MTLKTLEFIASYLSILAIGGDIHFDNDENFTYGKSTGTDVLWVAVHEAGHSLGLEHSQKLDAVMYPWYRGTTGNDFGLTSDDVKGIEALYGKCFYWQTLRLFFSFSCFM